MIKSIILLLSAVLYIVSSILMPSVYAGTLTSAKITITDSRAGQSGVSHTFNFTTGTTETIATVIMQYCTTASGDCTTPTGLITTSASQGSITGLGASTSNVATNGTITLTVTSPLSVNSGTTITLPYTGITNPSTTNTSFYVRLTTKNGSADTIDSTIVAFAILTSTSLAVSANVGATLSVSLAAVNTGSVNGATVNVTNTTATTIPFGLLTSGSTKIAAHDMTVSTNASQGYAVTIRSDDPPLADNSNNIDKFTGTNASPTSWTSPNGGTININTGFAGYTSEDNSLCTGTADRFTSSGGNKWAGPDGTPAEIICSTSAVILGETVRIGWQVEVNSLQPPGSYTGTYVIVTTPTY